MQNVTGENENTTMIYKTAKLVRNSIEQFSWEKKETDTITVSSTRDDIPVDLYSLIRWPVVGSEEQLQTEMRSRTVDGSALTISQNIM
jgi:hypothetical protein